MVVPTNAATIKFPPSAWGIEGINPLAISAGEGNTINMEIRKEMPISVTKKINTFSKKENRPTISMLYRMMRKAMAIPRIAQ